jgi:hypothetical protein
MACPILPFENDERSNWLKVIRCDVAVGLPRHTFSDFNDQWRHKAAATLVLVSLLKLIPRKFERFACQELTMRGLQHPCPGIIAHPPITMIGLLMGDR